MSSKIYAILRQQPGQYNAKPYTAFQHSLLSSLLGFFTIVAILFALRQALFVHDLTMIVADTMGAIIGGLLLYKLKKKRKVAQTAKQTTYFLFLFFLLFSIVNQNREFGLIWSIFFPGFAILLNGMRFGLSITTLYYLILLPFAYQGIGIWEDGAWTMQAFLRFSAASFGTILVISLAEHSRERVFKTMHLMHEKERRNARKLHELSHRDHLTELYNRRKLQEIFPKKIDSATRDNTYFCFFLLDIDFFKLYNDTYGHQMGDSALKEVANVMRENLRRSNDMVFRVGGEEFGGIILGASKEVIEERLNTIQTALCSANIEHRSSEVARHLTASIGAVISQPLEVCHGFENQFFEADRALYDCKSKGRNCISVVEM